MLSQGNLDFYGEKSSEEALFIAKQYSYYQPQMASVKKPLDVAFRAKTKGSFSKRSRDFKSSKFKKSVLLTKQLKIKLIRFGIKIISHNNKKRRKAITFNSSTICFRRPKRSDPVSFPTHTQ